MNNIIDQLNRAMEHVNQALIQLNLEKEKLQRNGEPSEQRTSQGCPVAPRKNRAASTKGSYCCLAAALELIRLLDQMERSTDLVVPKVPRLRRRSLRQKLYQAGLFLIDHPDLDPEGKYRQMRGEIEISNAYPAGV